MFHDLFFHNNYIKENKKYYIDYVMLHINCLMTIKTKQ